MGNPCSKMSHSDMLNPVKLQEPVKVTLNGLSTIFKSEQHQKFFQKEIIHKILIKQQNIKPLCINKIFTASEHAYEASSFHNLVNGYENTILLARTTQKRVFGGFTGCMWRKDMLFQYESDENISSFLFSLKKVQKENNDAYCNKKINNDNNDNNNNNSKNNKINNKGIDNSKYSYHYSNATNSSNNIKENDQQSIQNNNRKFSNASTQITKNSTNENITSKNISQQKRQVIHYYYQTYKIKNKKTAIMNHNHEVGPIFGQGHDIFISNKCQLNQSWCNIGLTYSCQYPYGSIKANSELCGKEKFIIQNYQIWHVELTNQNK